MRQHARRCAAAAWLALACGPGFAAADPTGFTLEVPAEAVLMGAAMARAGHSLRLATPSEEGQFELLVRPDATPVLAPHCRGRLILRMPGTIPRDAAGQAAVARKRAKHDRLLAAWQAGQRLRLDVFAGPYGRRRGDGRVELSGCNLFLIEPNSADR